MFAFDHAPVRAAICAAHRRDERQAVQWLLSQVHENAPWKDAIQTLACTLVEKVRSERVHASGVDALMHEFSLSSQEGVALMCLAEALLRIPDSETADRLIADKISKGDWRRHLGESPSLFINAATWGLLITGKLVATSSEHGLGAALTRLIAKGGEPLIRKGVDLAMRMLGNQFVTGQTIHEALANSRDMEERGFRYSYDMLGEAALTEQDAKRYCNAYEEALHAIGKASGGRGIKEGPGISVKLSALHPRYCRAQRIRVLSELLPRLKKLVLLAKYYDVGINIDAEEADRLEISLELIESLALDEDLAEFDGLGVVVQAYQKRAPFVIDYLADLARRSGRKLMVRLVKGAYWDAEIKRAQVDGMSGYPVYTRKIYTDLSYLVCAQKLLGLTDCIYPQFATHNAHTLAAVYAWARQQGINDYEFQCLHGMGESLYSHVVGSDNLNKACRIYAPVGSHQTLLAYLVRRLLENGANSSFVNQLVDEHIPIGFLLADPIAAARQLDGAPHPAIPLPIDLFGDERPNSSGIDFSNEQVLHDLFEALARFVDKPWFAHSLITSGEEVGHVSTPLINPADKYDVVGQVSEADESAIAQALDTAASHAKNWSSIELAKRVDILMRAANLIEQHRVELMALAVREAGKSLINAIGEVREAADFLRYYAAQIRTTPEAQALGPVVCISPWNFPLAIFIGQISAALAAGNVVLAKPAEQTPLIAYRAVQLLHEAGIPSYALQLLPGRGETVGQNLVSDPRVRGVIFTGSTEVAQLINHTLAERAANEGREIPFIAETGGQNAMIVDSSALPEQVVQDVLTSAFDSAGQRCSALRILCLQEEIADKVIDMLKGAMAELNVGNPTSLSTDIGPVIDHDAQRSLLAHIEQMKNKSALFFQAPLHTLEERAGTFVAPTVVEIKSIAELAREVFGPVLHVLRYRREQLSELVDAINATGYGLTMGIHSRIDETIDFISTRARVGNIYVNRNIIGAVVGVQPFGGEGKSGTGPKAGGPLYLKRLQYGSEMDLGINQDIEQLPRPAFHTLMAWLHKQGLQKTVQLGDYYLRTSISGHSLSCPGPTGERNLLRFTPRGLIWCVAESETVLLNQLLAVLVTGNTPVVSKMAMITSLPAEVHAVIQLSADEISLPIALTLTETSQAGQVRRKLALREGALVPVIETNSDAAIPIWKLCAERALCVNTAAAGGNASLMTLDA